VISRPAKTAAGAVAPIAARTPRPAALVAVTLALAACGGGSQPPRPATTSSQPSPSAATGAPLLCGPLRASVIARMPVPGLTAASGLVLARGVLWTHDDSTGPATLFEISTRGKLLRELPVRGVANVDWEDIAARGDTIYVGDIGDNTSVRDGIVVYRLTPGHSAKPIALRYPDGPHDAETLLVDSSGTMVIVTKSSTGESGVYSASGPGTLRKAGTLSLGLGETVTGGDVAGSTLVVRTYRRLYTWTRGPGEAIVHALLRRPCRSDVSLLPEGQGESIALARDGRSFYTLPEGPSPTLRRYVVSGP
jgi:hypothetical protein